MDVLIRKAQKHDAEGMMELIKELALYEKAPDEVTVSMEHFIESGFGDQPVWWAFVVEFEEKIVGFALYYIRYSTWKGQRLYLEDLIVTEQMRGKGIGAKLFEQVVLTAKQSGFSGITWQVLEWNQPAIHFYKKYNSQFDAEWWNGSINF